MTRLILILIIVFLIVRAFIVYAADNDEESDHSELKKNKDTAKRQIPKEVGEYIDYEEVKKR